MDYRLFKFRHEGMFTKRLLITEEDKLMYTMHRHGIFKNILEFRPEHNAPAIKIDKPSWSSNERHIYLDDKIVSKFRTSPFTLAFSVRSDYGNYKIDRDSLLSKTFTITNSTSEIGKLSRKGIISKEYGLALHAGEHIHFVLGLMGYLIHTIKKREESS